MSDKTKESGNEVVKGRREILASSSLLAAAGLLWNPGQAKADSSRHWPNLALDVACLGHTLGLSLDGAINPDAGDMRGAAFLVEGLIYPRGTIIPDTEFDVDSVPAMGHWFCRGFLMSYGDRPEPGANTTQDYLLELITADVPSPRDTLSSSGVENGGPGFLAYRSVIGGTGRYRGVTGEVVQETIGTNNTVLNIFGAPAPTFQFDFRLRRA